MGLQRFRGLYLGHGFRSAFLHCTLMNTLILLCISRFPAIEISTMLVAMASLLASLMMAFLWSVILYPKFFSPLRHLPQPPVCLKSYQGT